MNSIKVFGTLNCGDFVTVFKIMKYQQKLKLISE